MGDKNSTQLQGELARRVTGLSTGAGSAALEAINRAIRWINRQGSFSFQLVLPAVTITVASGGTGTAPSDFDPGKLFHLNNATNGLGLPIRKATLSDIWETRNFSSDFADSGFDRYLLDVNVSPVQIGLYPSQSGPCDVALTYHKKTVDLPDGFGSFSNLPRDFDDLIVDLAEAEEKRINDVGNTWQLVLARCQDQTKELLNGYRTASLESGPETDAKEVVQQKTATGRP